MAIEVISYNIQHGKNIQSVSRWITDKSPDVFCLQEFPEKEIGQFRTGYQELFAASFNKGGQVYGELIGYSPGMQLLSAYCVDLGLMKPNRLLSSAAGRRTALVASFGTGIGELVLGNIHLEWQARSGYKLEQLDKVIFNVEDVSGNPESPVILTGDFNYSNVFSGKGLEEFAFEKGYQMGGRFNTHRLFGLSHQVDYVFYKGCEIKGIRTEGINLSDHKPLLFTVSRNGV